MANASDLQSYIIRGFVNGLEKGMPKNEVESKGYWGKDNFFYCVCGCRTNLYRSVNHIDYFPVKDVGLNLICPQCNTVIFVRGNE